MAVTLSATPFGSETRTRALLALVCLQSSYPRELARLLGQPLSVVQKALATLERDGLVAAQTVGRLRLYRINPRYFARTELTAYLERLVQTAPDIRARAATLRRRPRRTGKPL
jgi:DNA-binding transcriptional ArsR family regulator